MSLTKIQKGVLLGLISAIFYGMQPIFSVYLQDMGMSNESILFYRNFFGALPLAIIMIIQKTSFRLTLAELVTLTYLAFLSDGSALFQLQGFDKSAGSIPTGVATTVRFVYPILTALIMMIFYKEKCGKATLLALFMAVAGVGMLSWPSESVVVKPLGVIFELLSALCYAFYVVRLNHSRVSNMDTIKLTFYVIFIGSLIFAAEGLRLGQLQPISNGQEWKYILILSFFCTTIVNLFIVLSARLIGSTLTSMLGALEPLTAILMGLLFMGETMTVLIGIGIVLVIISVLIIIAANKSDK